MKSVEEEYILVFVTFPSEAEARDITRALVAEKLLACGNIIRNLTSIYRWKGEVAEEAEALMIGKTRKALFPKIVEKVKSLHTYTVPEIIALPLSEGYGEYLSWIDESVRKNGGLV